MKRRKEHKPCGNAPACRETMPKDSDHDKCDRCRARVAAWMKRSVYEVLRYTTALRLRQARMGEVTEDRDIQFRPMYYHERK